MARRLGEMVMLLEGERDSERMAEETSWWVFASNQGPTAVKIASTAARADDCSSVVCCDDEEGWVESGTVDTFPLFPFFFVPWSSTTSRFLENQMIATSLKNFELPWQDLFKQGRQDLRCT